MSLASQFELFRDHGRYKGARLGCRARIINNPLRIFDPPLADPLIITQTIVIAVTIVLHNIEPRGTKLASLVRQPTDCGSKTDPCLLGSELGDQDSNLNKRIQSPLSYR